MKQNPSIPSKVRTEHLERESLVYVRQSTMAQVRFNQESTQRQYALRERALSLDGRKNTSASSTGILAYPAQEDPDARALPSL